MKNLLNIPCHPFFRWTSISIFLLVSTIPLTGQYSLITQEPTCLNFTNWVWAIADDGQGNSYIAGVFENSITLGSFTLTTSGGGTAFIGKFDSNTNNWLWVKKISLVQGTAGSYKRSEILDMTLDNSGNIYITGEYAGSVNFDNITLTSTKQGNVFTNDIFVAKLNAAGAFTWAKSFGSKAGGDFGRTIALDGTGNIYAGGSFTNKVATCSGSGTELWDVFLVKLNNAGTPLWQKRYANNLSCPGTNSGANSANDIAIDGAGNVYLTGSYYGTMSFGNGPGMGITSVSGTLDVFAAKISGSGTTQWVRSEGGSLKDEGRAIYTDASGNVYNGGSKGGNPSTGTNAFTSKYDASGSLLWSVNPFPLSASFTQTQVKSILSNNNSLLVYDMYIGFKSLSMADGAVITSDSIVGNKDTGNFYLRDAEAAGTGFAFVMNGDCGTVAIDNLVLTATCNDCSLSCGSDDMLMVRTSTLPLMAISPSGNTPVSVNLPEDLMKDDFTFFPNPASDILNIDLPASDNWQKVIIQNHFGKTIWAGNPDPDNRTLIINLDSRFYDGLYYISWINSGQTVTKPLIIAR